MRRLPRPPTRVARALAVAMIALGAALVVAGLRVLAASVKVEGAAAVPVATASAEAPIAFGREPVHAEVARWPGRVVRSSDPDAPVGAACSLEAVLRASSREPPDVGVACAGKLAWPRAGDQGPAPSRAWSWAELPGERPGVYRASLELVWRAPAAPGRDVEIDTLDRRVRIAPRAGGAPSVEIELAEGRSEPREGAALWPSTDTPPPPIRTAWATTGRVVGTSGAAPAAAGDACEVEVLPAPVSPRVSCRVRVRCGARLLYPNYADCTAERGALAHASDQLFSADDHDPKLELDVAARTLRLEDREDGGLWAIDVALAR